MTFIRKFELRLKREFVRAQHPGFSGSSESIRRLTASLPFRDRRVMLMSNKQYEDSQGSFQLAPLEVGERQMSRGIPVIEWDEMSQYEW